MTPLPCAVLRGLAVVACLLATPLARAGDLIEYYHAGLDHYFITGFASEIRALDSGGHQGWMRTGKTLQVFNAGDSRLANSVPICRFYGNPARGLDSHFYPATLRECEEVQVLFPNEWLLETEEAFRVHPLGATNGLCPANTKPVHRLYNGRADVNHRYTDDPAVVDAMLARGWALEGTGAGPRPVVFCSANIAPARPATGTPLCSVTPSTQYPVIGAPLELTASCTGSPTTYAWINCGSGGTTCTATSTSAGPVLYGVVATNGSGPGAAATVTLNWQAAATAAPTCTVSANTTTPEIGTPLTLTGSCNETVARYEWLACSALTPDACLAITECASATTACSPVGRQQGAVLYSLRASNNAGTGPKASVVVTWRASTTPPPPPTGTTPSCVIVASSTTPAVNTTLTLTASCTNSPTAYTWTNCPSTGTVCTTTESTVGNRTYSVNGRNASGVGPAASVVVTWQVPPTAPPSCTLSANPPDPYAGGTSTLTANCTQSPSSYNWVGCTASSGNTCTAARATTGSATYSVTATNALGTSAPASITLNWREPPPAGADFCGNYAKVKQVNLVWGGHFDTNDPGGGFEDDAVLVGRIRVPSTATASSTPGVISVVERIDGQAERIMSLSPSACDFRGLTWGGSAETDPAGATRPMAWAFGINPNILFGLAGMSGGGPKLIPGQTYYVNIRNRIYSTGGASCRTPECNVRITVNAPR